MADSKKINTALISVFSKEKLDYLAKKLHDFNINIISTGGTKKEIEKLNIPVRSVEDLTTYPSILGGRVKTLHPLIFGGILNRREITEDQEETKKYKIPSIDLIIVDLYPFEETLASNANHNELIEKIDIGGISLIRAAAKNYQDVLVVSSKNQYELLINLLTDQQGSTTLEQRKIFAAQAFNISSHYDTQIFNYLSNNPEQVFKKSIFNSTTLRYGENPHQKGMFFGNFDDIFDKLGGKEISYNNLLDINAAVELIDEFEERTFAILKHNNACGVASRYNLTDAWEAALAGDPVSAFGGVLVTNTKVDRNTAVEINKLFFEVIIAPAYETEAFDIIKQNKNRIILLLKAHQLEKHQFRSILNGVLVQQRDTKNESETDMKVVTASSPDKEEYHDLEFANKIVKHTKSNAIVLVKNKQLLGSGTGQTSRVDALKQAVAKARNFGLDLNGAAMASDAFFPFADSVEIAHKAGIKAVIQPGGSIRDKESIDYCNKNGVSMVFTGTRHFKH